MESDEEPGSGAEHLGLTILPSPLRPNEGVSVSNSVDTVKAGVKRAHGRISSESDNDSEAPSDSDDVHPRKGKSSSEPILDHMLIGVFVVLKPVNPRFSGRYNPELSVQGSSSSVPSTSRRPATDSFPSSSRLAGQSTIRFVSQQPGNGPSATSSILIASSPSSPGGDEPLVSIVENNLSNHSSPNPVRTLTSRSPTPAASPLPDSSPLATATVLDESDRDEMDALEEATSSFVLDDDDNASAGSNSVVQDTDSHDRTVRSTRATMLTDADLSLGLDPMSDGHNPFLGSYKLF